jgi:hypothetical protein
LNFHAGAESVGAGDWYTPRCSGPPRNMALWAVAVAGGTRVARKSIERARGTPVMRALSG